MKLANAFDAIGKLSASKFDQSEMTGDAARALENAGSSRRGFLRQAGLLVVGFSAAASHKANAQSPISSTGTDQSGLPGPDATQVDSWVSMAEDGTVTCYTGKIEFGQGFSTVQNQLIAEELGVPLNAITLIMGQTGYTPDQGVTSGSQSTITEFGTAGLRQALATARGALFELAAQWLDASPGQLSVTNGVVSVGGSAAQSVSYGQLLAGQRFNLKISTTATPKPISQWTILGTSVPRVDIPPKVAGAFEFVQNVRVPGMLHGKVVRPPYVGATVQSVDPTSVSGMPGNPQVVVVKNFIGVVADSEWHAINAAAALSVTWSKGAALPPNGSNVYAWMTQQPTSDSLTVDSGDTSTVYGNAATKVTAQYLHPYQMHGSIGTCCAVADIKGTGNSAYGKIWCCSQGVYAQRDSVGLVLGIPPANIEVIFVEGAGCYGLNAADSVSYDAALMSQAVGAPVRVQLSRKDELTAGESYGPAQVMNLSGGLNSSGQIVAWIYEGWTASKGNRPSATQPGNIISGSLAGFPVPVPTVPTAATAPSSFANNGNSACNYITGVVAGKAPGGTGNVASQRVLTHTIVSPFFTGPLRSPNRLQNTFANESFVDELAYAAGADPVQYRLRHLVDPRLIGVVNAAANSYGWDTRPSPKPGNASTGVVTGRGMSCVLYEGDNGYAAMVAEVSVDQGSGLVTVTKLVVAQDSGPVNNPDGLRNQMEGGAMQGMGRALFEQVNWNSTIGIITSQDWVTYPVYEWGMPIPQITTVIMNPTNVGWMGAGECAITVSGSAIANAIFDATGARARQIPFTATNVLAALSVRNIAAAREGTLRR